MTAADHIRTVSIIGAGSWGTAIAVVLAETHPTLAIRFWAYEESVVSSINELHENREFLPNVPLPFSISATNSLKEAVLDADMIIIAVPSKVIPDTAQKLSRYISDRMHVGFLTKGFCKVQKEVLTISQTIERYIPQLKGKTVAISGPSHAEEVSRYYHTCLNVASRSLAARKAFSAVLTSPYLQCRENDDIIGVEVGGTLKNPAAIAAGMISVLPNCGDNLAGALISEAMKEMIRLARFFDAREETLLDISGLGDLVATALSEHSRNRRFGRDIGRQIIEKDNSLGIMDRIVLRINPRAVIEKMSENLHYLAEGAYAIEPLIELATENDISVPVYRSLYEVLLNKKDPALLIETIKDPDRYEEIYRSTKMQIAERKKGLEAVSGRSFRKLIEKHAINALFVKKDGAEVLADQEEFILNLSAYRSLLAEDRGNRREIRLIDDVINRKTRRSVLNLLRFYSHSIADDYNSIMFSLFMLLAGVSRFFSGFSFRRTKNTLEGDLTQLRPSSYSGNIIYLLENRTIYDVFSVLQTIGRHGVPIPRFMVSSSIITGSLDSSIMRMSGGFIVDELKYENVVYRQVLHSYLSILIENGVPLLLFRDFQPGIADVQFQKRIIDVIKEAMFQKSVEVMIVPVSIAYAQAPEASGRSGSPSLKSCRSRKEITYRFSDPIFLSEFTREPSQSATVLPFLDSVFRKNKPFYPHTLMARVFAENGDVISRDDLESATQAFLDAQGISVPEKLRRIIDDGISYLRSGGIVIRSEDRYVVNNKKAASDLALLF